MKDYYDNLYIFCAANIEKMWAVTIVIIFIIVYYCRHWRCCSDGENIRCIVIDSGKIGDNIAIVASMHGNEPAGYYTIQNMLSTGEFDGIVRGKIVVIFANLLGVRDNVRIDPASGVDLNRQFSAAGSDNAQCKLILDLIKDCNIIVDLHEGWGWYGQNNGSIGSTVSPNSYFADNVLCEYIVTMLNLPIKDATKKFVVRYDKGCQITSSLGCYAEKNGIAYLLVETSGQNNVQPITVRVGQMKFIVRQIISQLKSK